VVEFPSEPREPEPFDAGLSSLAYVPGRVWIKRDGLLLFLTVDSAVVDDLMPNSSDTQRTMFFRHLDALNACLDQEEFYL